MEDDLAVHGLEEIGSKGRTVIVRGGSPGATAWKLTFEQLTDPMLASGTIAETELAAVRRALDDPAFAFQSMILMAAWGRKPAA